jgi:hypothetical protein
MNLAVYVRLLARRGVFIGEALCWYASKRKKPQGFALTAFIFL